MATYNVEIYTKSITEIDDPFITASYNANPIDYFKTMYNYLLNSIPQFNTPDTTVLELVSRVAPTNQAETFVGNGTSVNFVLSTVPPTDSYFSYNVNDAYVEGSFNYTNNTATLAATPASGLDVTIEWYSDGYFSTTLSNTKQHILSCFLVSCWAEKEKNFLLDIRRLLNDSTFKMGVESTNMKSKDTWFYNMREKTEKLMLQEAWLSHMATMKTRYGLS